ncbi:MAG: Poly-beta-1,6-N-acetyl-D-glucosamine N-deacetylase precursor [Pelotomaculum sp. PtaU1.Bin035]|nr:MAG: Poly-beta-1,6-N-acetyl-D-glucosamine N-deacetylase precursor [Pelotomaculum sp. PtaU1.Bin035]
MHRPAFIAIIAMLTAILSGLFLLAGCFMQKEHVEDKEIKPVVATANETDGANNTVKINFTKTIFNNSRLPILMFHSVNTIKPQGGLDPYWEWSFKELIDRMYKDGYKTITAKQAYDFNINKCPLPEKSIWLTFDDGYADNLTVAAPILANYGYVATVFVETSKIGSDLRLTQKQIATLRNTYNWDIQSHGYVGHQPISINEGGEKGSFYNDLKWLDTLSRTETMEERHARVKSDLQSSIAVINHYNPAYCFAYTSGKNGATMEIKADNDSVMNELGIMGVNVGKTGSEQTVPLNSTSPHRLCRIGISGETSYDKIFSITNFGLMVLVNGSVYNTRFITYDSINDRFVVGDTTGKIMTVGKDWITTLGPSPVQKPLGSKQPNPESFIIPTILPNGDIWVGSVTGSVLYKLDLNDLSKRASREIDLSFYPYNVVNDGSKLYVFDNNGVVQQINPDTGELTLYCTLPDNDSAFYTGSVLTNGILYTYDSKNNRILKYDFFNRSPLMHISWEQSEHQLQPWYIIDDNNILCYCQKNRKHVVLEYY